jgi:hypothetical protein
MVGPKGGFLMYTDIEDILQDQRRLLALYGPFHPYVKRFKDEHWDEPGFRWPCVWLYVKAALGLL